MGRVHAHAAGDTGRPLDPAAAMPHARQVDMTAARAQLLEWYDRAQRDLPWRRSRDPYAIWVSEIMLQQTRVETVIPYYTRFLERFPNPRALAEASEDDVLSAWSGLGYYRRARLLQAGAREVVARHGGEVPRQAEERRSLPGVGRYTAGAIGSIAFDAPEPIVDGNVARVLSRLLGLEHPLGSGASERALWQHAETLAQGPRPGALNQALMELGALVCTKAKPACLTCPWHDPCVARREGRQDTLPVPRVRKAPRPVKLVALVAAQGRGRRRGVWLVRGEGNLFGGLWSPPMAEGKGPATARALAVDHALGTAPEVEAAGRVRHVLSHRDLDIEVYRLEARARAVENCRRLVTSEALSELGISALTRKILRAADSGA